MSRRLPIPQKGKRRNEMKPNPDLSTKMSEIIMWASEIYCLKSLPDKVLLRTFRGDYQCGMCATCDARKLVKTLQKFRNPTPPKEKP